MSGQKLQPDIAAPYLHITSALFSGMQKIIQTVGEPQVTTIQSTAKPETQSTEKHMHNVNSKNGKNELKNQKKSTKSDASNFSMKM